jgi:hypothetical protein
MFWMKVLLALLLHCLHRCCCAGVRRKFVETWGKGVDAKQVSSRSCVCAAHSPHYHQQQQAQRCGLPLTSQ